MIAPVGSEVLLVAAVRGSWPAGHRGPTRGVVASTGSAGRVLAVNESEQPRVLRGGCAPRKLERTVPHSEIQASARIITRGTVDPNDDVSVLPGQSMGNRLVGGRGLKLCDGLRTGYPRNTRQPTINGDPLGEIGVPKCPVQYDGTGRRESRRIELHE